MFTGIIESVGTIDSIEVKSGITQFRISLDLEEPWDAKFGDSIAVNGCCLTVTNIFDRAYTFDVSSETLAKTNLSQVKKGQKVNLERAMSLGDRLGGHLVSGHVDGLGTISSIDRKADGWLVKVKMGHNLSRYVIPKGSICLDGVSLTVNELIDDKDHSTIHLMLIPATVQETTFSELDVGWQINVEVDMVSKFMERLSRFSPEH